MMDIELKFATSLLWLTSVHLSSALSDLDRTATSQVQIFCHHLIEVRDQDHA